MDYDTELLEDPCWVIGLTVAAAVAWSCAMVGTSIRLCTIENTWQAIASSAGFKSAPSLPGVVHDERLFLLEGFLLDVAFYFFMDGYIGLAALVVGIAFLAALTDFYHMRSIECPTQEAASTLVDQVLPVSHFNREVCIKWCRSTHAISVALQEEKCWATPASPYDAISSDQLFEVGMWCSQAIEEFVFFPNMTRAGISPFTTLASPDYRGDKCVAFVDEISALQLAIFVWPVMCGLLLVLTLRRAVSNRMRRVELTQRNTTYRTFENPQAPV